MALQNNSEDIAVRFVLILYTHFDRTTIKRCDPMNILYLATQVVEYKQVCFKINTWI